jgi:hypothetical protein
MYNTAMQEEMNHRISLLTEKNSELARAKCRGDGSAFYIAYLFLVAVLGFAIYSVYSGSSSSRGLPKFTKAKADTYQV